MSVYDEKTPLPDDNLLLLSQRQYSVHVSLKLVKEVPQRVNAPRFKKPKNYSYYVVVMTSKKKVLGWKRCSVVKHSTVKIPVLFSSNERDTLCVKVFCDSVVGIEVEKSLRVEITGNEEELKKQKKSVAIEEYVDEELDADEFSDSDYMLDEYLMDSFVCCTKMEVEKEQHILQSTFISSYAYIVLQLYHSARIRKN